MKIALLNLPYDNNYGGNLQRYALMTVLQCMGHDVTHINLRIYNKLPWYKKPYSYTKRFILKYILRKPNIKIDYEGHANKRKVLLEVKTDEFYNKYIRHTNPCYTIKDIVRATKGRFDVYIVGSDQIWRKSMTGILGINNYFLEFTKKENVLRIAYAASLGGEKTDYSDKDLKKLSELYEKFDRVTVRELSAVTALEELGWIAPNIALDPTLLLNREDYGYLIDSGNTIDMTSGKLYCYVLDMNPTIDGIIATFCKNMNCGYIIDGIEDVKKPTSIEQWLRNIRDARFVITDSYHGSVFSIIFQRPFKFCGNVRRGNSRVVSLFTLIGVEDTNNPNWEIIEENVKTLRGDSLKQLMI
ncbi:MAG: polysaccharide pyruvyl transferase family protein [Bacteroidaceae bacterium]|nr:polysaccharide pyruvyl transferase family protein [Bacteroidaceae bacterium]